MRIDAGIRLFVGGRGWQRRFGKIRLPVKRGIGRGADQGSAGETREDCAAKPAQGKAPPVLGLQPVPRRFYSGFKAKICKSGRKFRATVGAERLHTPDRIPLVWSRSLNSASLALLRSAL